MIPVKIYGAISNLHYNCVAIDRPQCKLTPYAVKTRLVMKCKILIAMIEECPAFKTEAPEAHAQAVITLEFADKILASVNASIGMAERLSLSRPIPNNVYHAEHLFRR